MFFSFYRLASYSHFFTKLRFLSNISSIAAAHTLLKIMKRPEKKIAKRYQTFSEKPFFKNEFKAIKFS